MISKKLKITPLGAFLEFALLTVFLLISKLPTVQSGANGKFAYFDASTNSMLVIRNVFLNFNQTNVVYSLSFRTCDGGMLINQNAPSGDSFKINVSMENLLLSWRHFSQDFHVSIPQSFADDKWYNLELQTVLGQTKLRIKMGQSIVSDTVLANSTYQSSLWALTFGTSSGLVLGSTFTGCMLEGPGIVFVNMEVETVNITWSNVPCVADACNVETSTSGYCSSNSPCENGGTCHNSGSSYYCECPFLFNGTNCENNLGLTYGCVLSPCLNNGTCQDRINPPPSTRKYNCTCLPGFAGANCEVNINECKATPNPCKNGGICSDGVNSFTCNCSNTGYEGKTCEDDINECNRTEDLCAPGTCFNSMGGFSCDCPPGYDPATNCSQQINECLSSPCKNGGTCQDIVNGFTCNCVQGFTGQQCTTNILNCSMAVCTGLNVECRDLSSGHECVCKYGYKRDASGVDCIEKDECESNPCQNRGTCIDGLGNYTCVCPDTTILNLTRYGNGEKMEYHTGYMGINCEININECNYQPSICLAGGTCEDKNGTYSCLCGLDSEGYYRAGYNCELKTSYCLSSAEVYENPPACHNGGTCINNANSYTCTCAPGFTDRRCMTDIDECESNPCQYNGTCTDRINNYTCECIPGITGFNCDIDIDECESNPCLNNGTCSEFINRYECNCTDTGFKGVNCEINIDDCLPQPCYNNATCIDKIKDFSCQCYDGYSGKSCDQDFDDCAVNPCFYNGTCLQRSNQTLYSPTYGLQDLGFSHFDYARATGYACQCIPGITGVNCTIDIDDCEQNNCTNGASCVDHINYYTCTCVPGYTGAFCEIDIDECELYKACQNGATCQDYINFYNCTCAPGYKDQNCSTEINECELYAACQHGSSCEDLVADYECHCPAIYNGKQYGGKNCTYEFQVCLSKPCHNGGSCVPILLDETSGQESFECLCQPGYAGTSCDSETTLSFGGNSNLQEEVRMAKNNTISFRFRTTLPKAILFAWDASRASIRLFMTVELLDGYVHFSYWRDMEWQNKSFPVSVNDGLWHGIHITQYPNSTFEFQLKNMSSIYQTTVRYNEEYKDLNNVTFGNIMQPYRFNASHSKTAFVGCLQDISINGNVLTNDIATTTRSFNVMAGCDRREQCFSNTCSGHGTCIDLWVKSRCDCYRPYTGTNCSNEFQAATFGHDGQRGSAMFDLNSGVSPQDVDFSLFVRTRQRTGFIAYFGDMTRTSFLTLEIYDGAILSRLFFCQFSAVLYANQSDYSNGYQHFVGVTFDPSSKLFYLKVNDTQLSSVSYTTNCTASLPYMYLGGSVPSTSSRRRRSIVQDITNQIQNFSMISSFKGTIQDVQVNSLSLQFFPEPATSDTVTFINVTSIEGTLEEGEVSEDICQNETPCDHGGNCTNVFFNTYRCDCPRGYRGMNCSELDFCQEGTCPSSAKCRNIPKGYECVSTATFDGVSSFAMYKFMTTNPQETQTLDTIRFDMRTLVLNGNIMVGNASAGNIDYYIVANMVLGHLEVECKFGSGSSVKVIGEQDLSTNRWYQVLLRQTSGILELKINELLDDGSLLPVKTKSSAIASDWNMSEVLQNNDLRITFGKMGTSHYKHFYKGCLKEIRFGNLLLPFHTQTEFKNFSSTVYYEAISVLDLPKGCVAGSNCNNHQCQGQSQCEQSYYDFHCKCPSGFSGRWCQNNIQDCQKDTCLNNALCVDKIDDYYCVCRHGFTGTRCDTPVDYCKDNPCQNNGSCQEDNQTGSYHCTCSENFVGTNCTENKNQSCSDNPCHNGATCTDTSGTFFCSCSSGYTGYVCDQMIDYCEGFPCQNGGNCSSSPSTGYICTCPEGYSGGNCSVNINDCVGQSCGNGNCEDLVNGHACNCSEGWEGSKCNQDIDECERENPCVNGNCTNTQGSFTCNCPKGYEGRYCSDDIDECQKNNPCQNGATCNNTIGSYDCLCGVGYAGKNCEKADCSLGVNCNNGTCQVDTSLNIWTCDCDLFYYGTLCEFAGPCVGNPCNLSNTESCSQTIGNNTLDVNDDQYTCHCRYGWKGKNCSTDINECENSGICNYGTCGNTAGNYTCTCEPGYTGRNCSAEINECDSSPCANGGTCVDLVNAFKCNCTPGFTNSTCMDDIDECLQSPCLNGASCSNTVGSFTCQCPAGYVGQTCGQQDPQKQAIDTDSNMWIIIGPVVAGVLLIIIVFVIIFLKCMRTNRATRGNYSPSRQEVSGSRVELENVMKPPPEERLI